MKKIIISIVVLFLLLSVIPGILYAKDGPKNKAIGEEISFWGSLGLDCPCPPGTPGPSLQYWVEFNIRQKGDWGENWAWPEGKGKLFCRDENEDTFTVEIYYVAIDRSGPHPENGYPRFFIGPVTETSLTELEDMWIYALVADADEPGGYPNDYIGWRFIDEELAKIIAGKIPMPPEPPQPFPPRIPWFEVISGDIRVRVN